LKIKDEVIGREVLDSTGHKIGEVEDVDVDFKSDRVDSLVLHEGGRFRGRERIIPFNMVETVGERVILKKETRKSREMME
jgi:sporulation protein YlmC with PRC-barrel domain